MSLDKSDIRSVSATVWVIMDCHMPICMPEVLGEPTKGCILRSEFSEYRTHPGSLSGSMLEYYLENIGSGLER